MNASRDRTPVLVLAGRTPNTEGGQLGSRSAHIHWGQDSFDQGAGIREWCKWDGELRSGQALAPMLSRAVAIARSEPCGPVYLTLPREVLAAPASSEHAEFAMVHGSAPDPDSLQEIASALLKAEFPLLITSAGGRDPAAFAAIETHGRYEPGSGGRSGAGPGGGSALAARTTESLRTGCADRG